MDSYGFPPKQGLYDPALEKDACGVGFVVNMYGKTSHQLIEDAATLSRRLEHRGARSGDNNTGDGAGIMTSIPHEFYAAALKRELNVDLPAKGDYATGILFLNQDEEENVKAAFTKITQVFNMEVLCWRKMAIDDSSLGHVARSSEPSMQQVFVVSRNMEREKFKQQVYLLRKSATHRLQQLFRRFYVCSLSLDTIVYKGQLTSGQLWTYFLDLQDPAFKTYFAIVHARFSTNTFPTWERAHPMRFLAHNGEINTLQGNVNLMRAREGVMESSLYGEDLKQLYPVVEPHMSDSGSLDNVLEFLVLAGHRSLPEAMVAMVPEAWQKDGLMLQGKKELYQWSACVMEPWDGPALVTFSDGRYVGAILDRNGLRPSRFYLTKDDQVIMASEVGVIDIPNENIKLKGRLRPGRMLLVDVERHTFARDDEVKLGIAARRPLAQWLTRLVTLEKLRCVAAEVNVNKAPQVEPDVMSDRRLALFGYTVETISLLLLPMIQTGKEALGSMGNDAPPACLSGYQPLVYDYFKQLFAQVTNPPIDPFREDVVISLCCPVGPSFNILEPSAEQCQRLWLEHPILSLQDLELIRTTRYAGWKTKVIDIVYSVKEGARGLRGAIERFCSESSRAVQERYSMIVLSDRNASKDWVPVSALLALGAVHHHLISERLRMSVGLVVETAEAREVHHVCVLLGYGADAVCPYLVFEMALGLNGQGLVRPPMEEARIVSNYIAALNTGISKVMAKMGISALQSYKGAQIFEALGIGGEIIEKCFKNTSSRIGGVSFEVLGREALERHRLAFADRSGDQRLLRNPGFYHWRSGGEHHLNEPRAIANLQEAVKLKSRQSYERFVESSMRSIRACTLRGQLQLKFHSKPLPMDEVEPASEIVKRFVTGAMSLGSISMETHETLAVAMNRIGGKSNTGEGGESSDRWSFTDVNNNKRSAIKQIASGRFGVTTGYLANADEIQIKMAQGAKPGEGGELPGHKVTVEIAATRHSTPGVGLISPPPHHDIYSIEDLSQLIYDLKCANPSARISVKLVSEVGVGIVASGVAKGKAEHITISGHDGGTGASSWTGIKGAGLPWELGVAETHQTLVLNELRSRVILQADGQLRIGFDVVVAAILGADEFGFSTAPLIALGCTMMRKCHLNTCPVGIATQDPVLRRKFSGQPEHVVNYFFLLAEEVRGYMSKLHMRKFQDLIGRTDLLGPCESGLGDKARMLDFSALLKSAASRNDSACAPVGGSVGQDFELNERLDRVLIEECLPVLPSLKRGEKSVQLSLKITNRDRAFGTTLSYHIAKQWGDAGLPDGSIRIRVSGTAGQSFCAFLVKGIAVHLEGDANDYVAKGVTGGEVVVSPPPGMPSDFHSELNVIAGNACLYGATSGRAFFRGIVAERFAVRNSGAWAINEGVGDHGCEYMTGGRVVVLGLTGRNFGAGMSGGIAYVMDIDGEFPTRCNLNTVDLLPVALPEDLEFLREFVAEFRSKTKSEVAARVLDAWPQSAKLFVKVFPKDYQAALKKAAATSSVGREEETVPDVEDIVGEKNFDKLRGFVKYKRDVIPYRPAEERIYDYDEIYDHKSVRRTLKIQSARCMDCGVPFCQSSSGCPLGNIIPEWNDLVFQDNWKEALDQLLLTNNFPEFTGRVCPAPCESACVLSLVEPAVTIKNIECAIIERGFEEGFVVPSAPARRSGFGVAVVGSGPAGLAAAAQLNKAGHLVTVFEKSPRVGGLLRYGIPTMKLSRQVIDRRIDLMQKEGVVFKVNQNVGSEVRAETLLDYDAVLLATGSTRPRHLPIPGHDLSGIYFAMDYLYRSQRCQEEKDQSPGLACGKDVLVIGGGDTGVDCMATALREGARSIRTLELLSRPPDGRPDGHFWPHPPKVFKMEYGHADVEAKFGQHPRHHNLMPKKFVGDECGQVCGLEVSEVRWQKDGVGRWNAQQGDQQTLQANLVLLALGFLGPESDLLEALGVSLDMRCNVETAQYRTSVKRLYAAGDCRVGQSLVVTAIAEGRQAARQIDEDLVSGGSFLAGPGGLISRLTVADN